MFSKIINMFSTTNSGSNSNTNNNDNKNDNEIDNQSEGIVKIEKDIESSAAALTELTLEEDDSSDSISSSSTSTSTDSDEVSNIHYGTCKWFNVAKGWGFIKPDNGGQDVFVHQSVIQMSGFRSLGEKEHVEYECRETERGLEATRVSGRHGDDCHGSTFRPRTKKKNRRVRCYNCGEFANHIASKCHLGPQPKRCHLCKEEGHISAKCPTKKSDCPEPNEHPAQLAQEEESKKQQETSNETS